LFETSERYLEEIQKHQYIFDRSIVIIKFLEQVDEKIIENITKN
jgi:hypothetical protein